jgi:hypothetical protein
MFGEKISRGPKVDGWLEQLRQAEPGMQRGELVHHNLRTDANVCDAHQRALLDYVDSRAGVVTHSEAADLFADCLSQLCATEPICTQADNSANRLATAPFDRLSRIVDGDSFVKYNLLPGSKRRVPRRFRGKTSVRSKVRLDEIRKLGLTASRLRGNIGGSVVFASSAEIADRRSRDEINDNDVRNRLGLDDPRFGRDRFMVAYIYAADRVPGDEFYRPTVLDAGWSAVSAAFLSSEPGTAKPGRTQDIGTGEPAEPEVLHRTLLAQEVENVMVLGPLTTDPPDNYKAVRLGLGEA